MRDEFNRSPGGMDAKEFYTLKEENNPIEPGNPVESQNPVEYSIGKEADSYGADKAKTVSQNKENKQKRNNKLLMKYLVAATVAVVVVADASESGMPLLPRPEIIQESTYGDEKEDGTNKQPVEETTEDDVSTQTELTTEFVDEAVIFEAESGGIKCVIYSNGRMNVTGTCEEDGEIPVLWQENKAYIKSAYFDVKGAKVLSGLLSGCEYLEKADLSNLDTSRVISMSAMFSECPRLTTLDLSSFDTGNVSDMSYMFSECANLTTLDLSGFDTGNVTYMEGMFDSCRSLSALDISNFDTGNVSNMAYMFYECENLITLNLSNFDTANVSTMQCMFLNCTSLTTLDLSSFDTGKATYMEGMFSGCTNLKTIYVGPEWIIAPNSEDMFANCDAELVYR